MAAKTDTEVIIGGRVYTLSGFESEEYLQKVASYLNNKLAEYTQLEEFKRLSVDMQNVLVQLNVADDYFKAKKQISDLEEQIEDKEKELYDLKHELIATQMKQESIDKKMRGMQENLDANEKKIIQMETELKGFHGN